MDHCCVGSPFLIFEVWEKDPAFTIRVKRPPKPEPVKHQPLTACCFYFPNSPCLHVYIFVTPPVLANVANAPQLAGYRRRLPCRFVVSSAAPTAPPRGSLPSFPRRSTGLTSTSTNLDNWLTPRRRTGLGTDDDALMTSTIA